MKRAILFWVCGAVCILLMIFSPQAKHAAASAFTLWCSSVLPVLLPFFVCSALMAGHMPKGRLAPYIMLICAVFTGAPSGAKAASQLASGEAAASRMAAACNVASPMFIIGTFAGSMANDVSLGIPIAMAVASTALLSVFTVTRIDGISPVKATPSTSLASALGSAMSVMLSICAAMICFSVLLALAELLPVKPGAARPLLSGMLEMVTGAAMTAKYGFSREMTAAAAAFLFSFAGLCVMAQSMPFLRIRPLAYIAVKLPQAVFSGIIAYLLVPLFPPDTASVFASAGDGPKIAERALSALSVSASISLGLTAVWVFTWLAGRKGASQDARAAHGLPPASPFPH